MSVTEHPAAQLAVTRELPDVGVPTAGGRWQPSRAGVVNSWAWANEVLLFADGWLTLTGPNGSGKSLTASMLITLLLDADSSQTALSVSGKAAGTLTSRHTDRNDREDSTGAWWLEYGMLDADSGETMYLTTGLWLRAVSGNLHRAFFLAPGRIGQQLVLEREGNPVRIDDLAAQLAEVDGELFTSAAPLRSKAGAHLAVVGDEPAYRQAVRTRLFAPLDEVQFDALVGVLRSLRSLRTAEAIPPAQMRAVLTEALPALDPERLTVIAEAMERISELETQLADMRYEAKQLATTDKRYQRYVAALIKVEAARLTAANTDFDAQARRTRDATSKLEQAQREQAETEQLLGELNSSISTLEGRRDAADTALRGHAGAELPLMERRAAELAGEADRAKSRAEDAAVVARSSADQASEAAESAKEGTAHLARLAEELRSVSREVGADAALDRIFAVTTVLTSAREHDIPAVDLQQTCSTPLAWVVVREEQVTRVEEALRVHADAQHHERSGAGELRRCEQDEDSARHKAERSSQTREIAEANLVEAITTWGMGTEHLGVPPADLLEPADAGARLALDRLDAWVTTAANQARTRIDLAGHQRAAATADALRQQAEQALLTAEKEKADATATAEEAASALQSTRDQASAEEAGDQCLRDTAAQTFEEESSAARRDLDTARQAADNAEQFAARTVVEWVEETHRWRGAARFLTDVPLPEPGPDIDPASARLAVERAHSQVSSRLERLVDVAQREVESAEAAVGQVESELAEARRAAPTPTAPPWRTRDGECGEPLWALVDFTENLSSDEADRLEGALLVSGLLDALVTPEGLALAGDLVITAEAPASGRTLADVLRLEASSIVPAHRAEALLRSIPADHVLEHGHFSTGVLTAAAPEDYRAKFIGRTTRERRRLKLVADLESALADAVAILGIAEEEVATRKSDVLAVVAERDAFPSAAAVLDARDEAARLRSAANTTLNRTTERLADAERVRDREFALLDASATKRAARIAAAEQQLRHDEGVADRANAKAAEAAALAEERREASAEATTALAEATEAQQAADTERMSFPPFDDVRRAAADEDRDAEDLRRASGLVIRAAERHLEASEAVREALRKLNQAAALPDGTLLPTEQNHLRLHGAAATRLGHQVELWHQAADRSVDLFRQARIAANAARQRAAAAAKAGTEADEARLTAIREAATVAEARELHGAEYERLRTARAEIGAELSRAKEDAHRVSDRGRRAENAASAAQATLEGIAPQREAAEQRRDACVRQLGRLVDERLTTVPEDLSDESGKPAHLTAALTWARRLLQHHTGDRLETLRHERDRAVMALESSARATSTALARFDRQVVMETIEGTEWRRAVVADPGSSRGEDLHTAVEKLETTAAQLEDDLRDDVKRTLKTSLFTQLRRDIVVRLEAAKELVRHIRDTLDGVRTGVADVGVQVEWVVRADEDARRMIDLIAAQQSDELFEDMYTVLRHRMDEKAGDSWKDRVAHTFDYRSWHEWKIYVTHASFTGPDQGRFREVNERSRANPLESLSTGERRLATMLPLLAAAWSMYSGPDYQGPRWVLIDEIDAAFDEPNLRQVLALLRSWNFDVLATAPFITPMIKKETGRVVLHELVTVGKRRVTVPWLWHGHGEPEVLTLDLDLGGGDDARRPGRAGT